MCLFDPGFFAGKRVFVTGHTGFKGSWLCRMLVLMGAQVTGYSLSPPTTPSLFEMCGVQSRMRSVHGDVRNLVEMRNAFDAARPQIVLHLAAQPIVRAGYEDPVGTYETNVMGTVHLLECVRSAAAQGKAPLSVLNVTTDKVYLNREWCWGYREDENLDGFDPYSNSKSCSELVTHSYYNSFFNLARLPVSTARAGNVIGGGDFARDRIIPDCVRAVTAGIPILVRNPRSIRPYQHVLEPLSAYLMITQRQVQDPEMAGWYNVGPDDCDCVTTGQLVDIFCSVWGKGASRVDRPLETAPHEANFLKLDCTKLKTAFGWTPRWHIGEAVGKTVEWTKTWLQKGDVAAVMDRQIKEYLEA